MSIRRCSRHIFLIQRSMTSSSAISNKTLQSADQALATLQKRVKKMLNYEDSSALIPPSEEGVQSELAKCKSFAKSMSGSSDVPETALHAQRSSASTLLTLEKGPGRMTTTTTTTPQSLFDSSPIVPFNASRLTQSVKEQIGQQISELADSIIEDPRVFITPPVLSKYVNIQTLLGHPMRIPRAFDLYASKPIFKTPPRHNTPTIITKLKIVNRFKLSSAIPLATATIALNSAIAKRDLSACFSIIDTSVATSAFRRSKLLHHASLPFATFVLTPPAAYILASQMAPYQTLIDVSVATNTIFTGLLAYVGFTAMLGFVAVTTANDQMDRVTWAIGTPLRERWLREEERAMIDRVAGAWGFQDPHRRGEEEGVEWEQLHELIGLRGMVLDQPALMEGME